MFAREAGTSGLCNRDTSRMTGEMVDVAHRAAVLRNDHAGKLISQWAADNQEGAAVMRAMWGEMKTHRAYLRSVGEYPVRHPKPAPVILSQTAINLLFGKMENDMFVMETGIPLPGETFGDKKTKTRTYPFDEMKDGESFVAPPEVSQLTQWAAANWRRLHPGWDYRTATLPDGSLQVWCCLSGRKRLFELREEPT